MQNYDFYFVFQSPYGFNNVANKLKSFIFLEYHEISSFLQNIVCNPAPHYLSLVILTA